LSHFIVSILAQTTQPAANVPGWYKALFGGGMFPLVIIMLVVWMFLMRGKGTNNKELANRLKEMKRGDRVQTIGGILGTVVEAREDEVVVKVDETSNTKIKFARKAISHVLEDEKAAK
jgi:preprotein translocase subunit YajC